jgi:glycosyltransferase involved in cell wall biosynthesis
VQWVLCYALQKPLKRQSKKSQYIAKGDPLASLSVIVITKNEARNIEACLQSASFADQIVVLDSGSTDQTAALARSMGAQVAENSDWQGFGIQKNRALELATSDWVLSIDADEQITPALRAKIIAAVKAPDHEAYAFPRLSKYCGQYIHHSGWYPDRVTRLFRRGEAAFSADRVHEKVLTSHAVGLLDAPLLHESFASFESVLDKLNRYSSAGAQALHERGITGSLGKALAHGGWAFFRTYVLRRGFLDGRMGLVLAISNAEGTYYRYLKLWLIASAKKDEVNGGSASVLR